MSAVVCPTKRTLLPSIARKHQRYLEWTPSRIVEWGSKIGPVTAELFDRIIASKPHPEQGFRTCLGVIRLGEVYGKPRLEAVAQRALQHKVYKSAASNRC
jgi:transposase